MLTPAQRSALDLNRHLCVTANAGSGKTRVLVERYLRILRETPIPARQIVALTFTEKAAGELRRRIADAVAEDPAGFSLRGEQVRAGLSPAFIGTIHGFCAQLLREFPVEAGVDAGFAILEGIDRSILLEEAVQDTFRTILRGEKDHALRAGLLDAVREVGKSSALRLVDLLVDKREIVIRWNEEGRLYAADDDAISSAWDSAVHRLVVSELVSDRLRADLGLLAGDANGKNAGRARGLIATALAGDSPEARLRALLSAAEIMVTTKGAPAAAFAGEGCAHPDCAAAASRLLRWRTVLLPLAEHLLGAGHGHRKFLAISRAMLETGREAARQYERRKTDAGVLDFDDLQLRARDLLRQEAVRRRIREQVRFLLVDEYQDTSRVQEDLLLSLTDNLRGANLFIVGDPKQSIYGFRDADVRVFERTRTAILAASGPGGDVLLGESFRPLRDLVAFTNHVFAGLLPSIQREAVDTDGVGGYGVRYDPLVRARPEGAAGRVELILDSSTGEQGDGPDEAELVARRIVRLVSGEAPEEIPGGGARRVRWGDIAVLLRARTPLPRLEEALFRNNIPYAVTAGAGYFQTQDVLDVFNYFRFLSDPSDDAALAGALRSPFFLISDAELFMAAASRRRGTLWHHLAATVGGPDTPPPLRRAVETLRADLAHASALPVPELLERIVRQASYEGILAGSPRGAQALANLDKLRRLARAFDRQGLVTTYDFVQRIGRLVREEEKEGQGAVVLHGDAVQVMTVHAAKGLEFPVVFLPGLHRPFRSDSSPYLHEDLGLGFPLPGKGEDTASLPVVSLMQELARRKALAEEVRVLYVAVTRARDMLVLSGDPAERRADRSPLGWILETLSVDPERSVSPVTFPCVTETLLMEGGEFRAGQEEHLLQVHLIRSADLHYVPVPRAERRGTVMSPRIDVEPIPALPRGEMFSATRLRTYLECPAGYYLRYVLGFPDRPPAVREGPDPDPSDLPSDLLGRVFHAVMERADAWKGNTEQLRSWCAQCADLEGLISGHMRTEFIEAVSVLAESVTGSPFWNEIHEGTDTRTEFTLSIPFDTEFLTGTIDRTFVDREGRRVVVDYKTDLVDIGFAAAAAERHRPQLALYALLARRFFPEETVRTVVLFARAPGQTVERLYGAMDLEQVENEIRGVLGKIRRGEYPSTPKTCQRCPLGHDQCDTAIANIRR